MVDAGTVLAGLVTGVGVVVWLVRLEGRINVTDARYEDIVRRLERIDYKLNGK